MVLMVSMVAVTWPVHADGPSCQQKWVSQPPPGGFVMEEVGIIARVETRHGNYQLVTAKYNVAVDN